MHITACKREISKKLSMKTNELLGFNMFPATQVAAAHDNKGAVRVLLEKGFVLKF